MSSSADTVNKTTAPTTTLDGTDRDVWASVEDYYGRVLEQTSDLKTNACVTTARPPPQIMRWLRHVPSEVTDKYYGCGTPLPLGIDGLRLLDLGSGSGRDCYIAAALVGEQGHVTGVDMTASQIEVAAKHTKDFCCNTLQYDAPNMEFKEGMIEYLGKAGIANGSMDIVISNCVVNLSPHKELVLRGVYDALVDGGEFYFSDVYCDRRLPAHVRTHAVLFGECLAGAMYVQDFVRLCHRVGFVDPRVLSSAPIDVRDPELQEVCGNAVFTSITYRLFKLPRASPELDSSSMIDAAANQNTAAKDASLTRGLETACEDYGQVAVYNGTIDGHTHSYALDSGHTFPSHKPSLVCGNTAAMLSEPSWLAKHFTVTGDRSRHFGLFDCGTGGGAAAAAPAAGAAAAASSGSGGGGGCAPGACGPGGC